MVAVELGNNNSTICTLKRREVFLVALEDEADKALKTNISITEGICQVVISGELDWTKDSEVITKCLNEVWSNENITYLELDGRDLFFANNDDGTLGTYFLAVMLELKETARKRHVRLVIRLKSKKQASILSLWGNKMWRRFRRHLLFDDPG